MEKNNTPAGKGPEARLPRGISRLGRRATHFAELPDGTIVRRPTTMIRPLTARESILFRPATTLDIIGPEEAVRIADEQVALRAKFEHEDFEVKDDE